VRDNVADRFQINGFAAWRGLVATGLFPKAEQAAAAGMQDLGIRLACFDLSVNQHFCTLRRPVPLYQL
jgi:hypothetical protein